MSGEIATHTAEVRYLRKDGGTIWVNRTVTLVRNAAGNPLYFVRVMEDVTVRKEMEARMFYQAHFDDLTKLPNRGLCYDRLKLSLSQAQRAKRTLGVLFIDLDRFKVVNDTLGHGVGDLLLQEVSARLNACIRSGDTIGRLGGDEFLIILPEVANAGDAALIARKVIEAISRPFLLEEHEVFVTTSIGVATYPDDGNDANALIKNSDTAMFHAKDLGRNRYHFYAATMSEQALQKMRLENALRRALERE